ncbi:hypothetical protein [Streptomyces sp. NPDC047028]|uniref:hypothetical protein n=1 Tax=Streptomyces sp. NPDC047028 TaxID=3155793 RepID=UPI0033D4E5F9
MSTYNFHGNPTNGHHPDPDALLHLTGGLLKSLRAEYPGLVRYGEIIQGEAELSAEDGDPPNRGKIRTALEAVTIGAAAGTGSLAYTRELVQMLAL